MGIGGITAALASTVCIVALATPAHAQELQFNIPAGSLKSALDAYSRQAGRPIIYKADEVRGVRSNGFRGASTAQAALDAILAKTSFSARTDGSGAVAIVRSGSNASSSEGGEVGRSSSPAEAVAASSTEQNADEAEIVVTGSRLSGAGEGATPVTTFSREAIDRLGVANVADVLNYLPQQSFSFSENFNAGSARSLQLRGLGIGTTLVLINGRRAGGTGLQSARAFFDVNTIPVSAVERIEILANSASAVYGADAIGGVVNIILKRGIDRPSVDLYYGFTPEGDSDEKRATLSFGLSSGGFRSGFTFDYFERTPLFGAERAFTANQDFRRFGGVDGRTANANPGNVTSATGAPLPGLSTTFAAVPVGSTGIGLTPADFQATAGVRNLESTGRFASIIPAAKYYSAVAFAEYELSPAATIFGEFMYVKRDDSRLLSPPSLSNSLVPATNPFNPFGVPVRVNFLLQDLPLRDDHSKSNNLRAVAGAKGRLGGWRWEISGLFNRDDGSNVLANQLDPARVTAALASTNPATALNPFQDGPGGSPELLQSLLQTPSVNRGEAITKQLSAFVSGALINLPGGPVQVVLGGEARRETIDIDFFGIILAVDRTAKAGFGEIRAPIVSEEMGIPLVHRFTVTGAARYDDYSDFGGTFNPQVGAEWWLSSDLMLRASYGTSFRPPTLFELYQPRQFIADAQTVTDRRRGNEVYSVDLITGGNAELEPEKAKSYSAGLVFAPRALNGLRVSVDYWRINQNLRVQRFVPNVVLNNEDVLHGKVIRDAPTPADIAAGFAGRIAVVDASSANFGGVDTSGFDFKVEHHFETDFGKLRPSLLATYVSTYKASTLPGQPAIERAGLAGSNPQGSIPDLKIAGTLAWSLGGASVTTVARYVRSYRDVNTLDVKTGRRVPSRLIVDAQIGYTFGGRDAAHASWLDGLSLQLGAFNLFDKEPDFASVGGTQGFDPSQAELRQRFLYVRASKTF